MEHFQANVRCPCKYAFEMDICKEEVAWRHLRRSLDPLVWNGRTKRNAKNLYGSQSTIGSVNLVL